MSRLYVTRPADLRNVSMRELLDAWHAHSGPLVNARHKLGAPWPAGRLARSALDALAVGQALADQLTNTRWVTVADALEYGARLDMVAAAMGLDVDEVAAGLTSWADGQHREHLMTDDRHDAVLRRLAAARATDDR